MKTSVLSPNRRVVCILGMHRSGTSVVARLLNLIGLDLGPAECLLAAGSDNPKGFWEHQGLTHLNEEILGRMGGFHLAPPPLAEGWTSHPDLAEIRARALNMIQADFAGKRFWGWKDPRNSLTLAFWQELIPQMSYVICIRNPIDVARSLERRNGVSFDGAVELWQRYIEAGLRATSGRNRILVFYEDIITEPLCETQRLSRFLGKPKIPETDRVNAEICAFVEGTLQHYRSSILEAMSDAALDCRAKAIFVMLRLFVDAEKNGFAGEQQKFFDQVLDAFAAPAI